MRANSSLPSQSLSAQSGIALITVLLFLILIMIIGAIAVRQANVDLNVAASDQVGTLLMNNSDSVLAHIELVAGDENNTNTAEHRRMMSQQFGVLGHFTTNAQDKKGDQVSFCYTPKNPEMFDRENAYTRKLGNGFTSKRLACDANDSASYSSDRHTSMTQVVVRGMQDEFSDNFDRAARGTSDSGTTDKTLARIQLSSVSVLPSMSDKPAGDIQKCLGRPTGNVDDYGTDGDGNANLNDCLRNNSIPSTFVVEEGTLVDIEEGGYKGTAIINNCPNDEKCSAALAR